MQQLTLEALSQAFRREEDAVRIQLPLPHTPASTLRWVSQFARLTGVNVESEEWGADRFQATLFNGELRILLNIEWLCDAIWLELIGSVGNAGENLWQWCQQVTAPTGQQTF